MRTVLIATTMAAVLVIAGIGYYRLGRSPQAPAVPTAALACGPGLSAASATTLAQWAQGAQRFDGLGSFARRVSTTSDEAQQYFNQGMRYLWAFNHDESTRSFAKAAELDPQCAMCFWGAALTVGPNYNLPFMAEPRAQVAYAAMQQAMQLAAGATPVEQALIAALAQRYPNAQPLDPVTQAPVLSAYAGAMKAVAQQFPDDLDVQTLYAESLMNINAWKLWSLDGTPAPGTETIIALLGGVLARDAQHPGANHYLIHAVEASPQPERGVAAAERLRGMMPAAGHLEHMPAHILQRVGRYAEAADANRKGAAADLAYFAKTKAPDYYAMYTGHNYQFLAFSTAMAGRKAETLEAARASRAVLPDAMLLAMPGVDWYIAHGYAAKLRFGLWDEMLAEPAPDARLLGLRGGYLYARAVALAAKARIAEAKQTLADLEQLAQATPADYGAGLNTAHDMFAIARLVAGARIAAAEAQPELALKLLREAVVLQDRSAYDEPEDWFFPVRHLLGANLLQAGQAAEAEQVYRRDLQLHPRNGWALFGLAQALKAQQKSAEAAAVEREFQASWREADVSLSASAF